LLDENAELQKQLSVFVKEKAQQIKKELKSQIEVKNGINFLARQIDFDNSEEIKNILFEIKNEVENCFCGNWRRNKRQAKHLCYCER